MPNSLRLTNLFIDFQAIIKYVSRSLYVVIERKNVNCFCGGVWVKFVQNLQNLK